MAGLPHDDIDADRVMVDGKTLRGAVQDDGRAVHLVAAMTGGGAVLAQREVGHKTNEITQVRPLLEPLGLCSRVVTLDALHAQRETARFLVEDKGADYIFTAIKDNQPSVFDALAELPWASVPVRHVTEDRGHGRQETRTIQVMPAPAGTVRARPSARMTSTARVTAPTEMPYSWDIDLAEGKAPGGYSPDSIVDRMMAASWW